MASVKVAAFALALLGSSMAIGEASAAMPVNGLAPAKQIANGVQDVRYVCGPYRCWWRPGPYWGHRYWGYGRWGWHRWGGHRWGWHHG
jgi:hypothetical protein